MTSSGILFLFLLITSIFNEKRMLSLLFVASLFQGAALLNIGKTGIPIFTFIQIFFIISYLIRKKFILFFTRDEKKLYLLLLIFFIYSIISLSFPFIFEGINVFNPRLGIDAQYGLGNQASLVFTMSNIAQIIYLFINILTFIIVIQILKKAKINMMNIISKITWIAIIGSIYSIYAFIYSKLEVIENFLYNNLSYAIGNDQQFSLFARISGTFLEPSMAGSFYASVTLALLFYPKKYKYLFLFSLLFLLLSTSSTAYISFVIGICIIIFNKIIRDVISHHYLINKSILIKFIIPIIIITGIIILYHNIIFEGLDFILLSKGDSDSLKHRVFSDLFSIDILINTYGLGSGLGSNRSSSFLFTLFSTLGLIGSSVLMIFIINIYKISYPLLNNKDIYFAFVLFTMILLSMFLSIPDISYSYFWLYSALLIGVVEQQKIKDKYANN